MIMAVLIESHVPTAWRVLRLQMEETASRYGRQLGIYRISSLTTADKRLTFS
jgi:hypothetical protein